MASIIDIPVSADAASLFDALTSAGRTVAIVGGAVRDTLMGRPIRDLDAVTDASPDDVRAVCSAGGWCRRVFAVGERYGTLGVVLADGEVVEVSRMRGADFAADAALRDFTVNAMAATWPALELLDPLGGQADLAAGTLRAPGDAAGRFAEDPLRVLRAARFVAELGFALEPATGDAAAAAAAGLSAVSIERVRDELSALLVAEYAERGLETALRIGALAMTLPEVAALDGLAQPGFHDLEAFAHTAQAVGAVPREHVLRWAALLHDVGKAVTRTVDADGRIRFIGHAGIGAEIASGVCGRLRLSNTDTAAVVHLVREHMRLGEMPADNARAVDRAVRRLDLWAPGSLPPRRLVSAEDALELELADFAATAHRDEAPERRRVLSAALEASRERGTREPMKVALSGRELMAALNLAEGPAVGAAMRAVEDAVADGRIDADDRPGALEVARESLWS